MAGGRKEEAGREEISQRKTVKVRSISSYNLDASWVPDMPSQNFLAPLCVQIATPRLKLPALNVIG